MPLTHHLFYELVREKDVQRFWQKVPVGNFSECWEWRGNRLRKGCKYGVFSLGQKNRLAHRVAFALANGRDPKQLVIHSCDNPPCVNPFHLRDASASENIRDCFAKGRSWIQRPDFKPNKVSGDQHWTRIHPEMMPRGDQHWTRRLGAKIKGEKQCASKLTEDDVRTIRHEYKKGIRGCGVYVLAKRFGVSPTTVWAVVANKNWSHVDE